MTVSHPFSSPTATKVIRGIATCLSTGRAIDRAFIVRRFAEGGYADHLAERYADRLIAANTDIKHWSRWEVYGTIPGKETYRLTPTFLKMQAEA